MKHKKKNGVYYTPSNLAEYLAEPLVSYNDQEILDPAYGEGALLLAAEKIFKTKSLGNSIHLYGCDTKPVNGLLKHLPEANLLKTDFFDYPVEKKFQTILMNPPYVRHHIQNGKRINKYRASHDELKVLNNSADLWALFLIKAVSHLRQDGSIGAILPWAFLQADYSQPLRKWLCENFALIEVVALSDKYFEEADERVVILWLKQYGKQNTSIKIAASTNIRSKIDFTRISLDRWLADRVVYTAANAPDEILSEYESVYGFTKFSDHADVKIGVVTGAVAHFIVNNEKAKEYGIPQSRLIPVLKESSDFPEYIKNGKKNLNLLVALKNKDHLKYRKFIRDGIADEYNLRAHSKLRKPWYAVKIGQTPDAFFHYRIAKIPYLLLNDLNIQCTNAIHRIYFKKLTSVEKKWIHLSILSAPSQLSIELNAKTYGRGILKIEPRSLKNVLVVKRNDPKINLIYKKVLQLLAQNNKEEAMELATEFISQELKINDGIIKKTKQLIECLQNIRHSPKEQKT